MKHQPDPKPSKTLLILVAVVTFVATLALFWTDAPG
jgi:hypothetical protein